VGLSVGDKISIIVAAAAAATVAAAVAIAAALTTAGRFMLDPIVSCCPEFAWNLRVFDLLDSECS